ncbi:unnamed protein product [Callosobruchus maculatus]|uniref:Uncharacterized protein n=1 Tax=Callosobruchus maculatus TaxID=64391 RepID=A0A653CFH0_CALMS|nr:unnamed protein product [Callosobruchus maculatus]
MNVATRQDLSLPRKRLSSTDTADEPMDVASSQYLSPPRKRSKKNHFDVRLKEVALKIGIYKRSVYKVVREYRTRHSFAATLTNQNRNRCIDLVDHDDKSAIRRKVHQFSEINFRLLTKSRKR